MTITGAIVLFSVTWFMVFFCVLPLRFQSQADKGRIVPGTPPSAPAEENVGRAARTTTWVALVIWLALVTIIMSGWIGIDDLNIFGITP